jgi:hypothetical protein
MNKAIQQCISLYSGALLFLYMPSSALAADKHSGSAIEFSFSIEAGKTQYAKKHRVTLIAAGQNKVLCKVNGISGKAYQIFVFTIESRLVTQTSIRSGETAILNNLSKGNYLVDVLLDDEKVESGQLIIK